MLTSCQLYQTFWSSTSHKIHRVSTYLKQNQTAIKRMGILTKRDIPYCITQSLETFKINVKKKKKQQMQLVYSEELWDLRQHACLWEHIVLQAACYPICYQNLCWPKNSPLLSQSYRISWPFPSCLSCLQLGAQTVFPVHSPTGKGSAAPVKFSNK